MEKILISACLLGQNCKYDGTNNSSDALNLKLAKLAQKYELIKICPEELGGLKTPREAAEILNDRVVTKFSGLDVTDGFIFGARVCLDLARLNECKIAVLKARSSSCGSDEIYDGNFTKTLIKGDGVCAKELKSGGIKIYSEENFDQLLDD